MNPEHIIYLRCPKIKNELKLVIEEIVDGKVKSGSLIEPISNNKYPILNYIPRFVSLDNYTNNFGLE